MPQTLPLLIFLFLLGLAFGSFGNVLIYRLPRGESIGGRSHCPHCKKTLSAYDLVPIASFLFLLGLCRRCKHPISSQYLFVEMTSGLLFLVAGLTESSPLAALVLALALWLLFLIAVCDAKTGGIPDALNIPFVLVAMLYGFLTNSFSLIAPLIGGGVFAAQWGLSRGRWVGSGDIILGMGMGFLLGTWQSITIALWFAYVLGAIIASALLVSRQKTLQSSFPFGPLLAVGTVIAFFYVDTIMHAVFG